jgi:hypothetical protein
MKGIKEAIKYQIEETKEMIKSPWFWVYYTIKSLF